MDLPGKVAIVTGGASGLGRATAERFAQAGARIAVFDLNRDAGQGFATALGEHAMFCEVDVADDGTIAAAIDAVVARFGTIDICVNCAGRGGGATKTLGKKGRFPLELFREVINTNLIGTFAVLTRAAEVMARNEPGGEGERGVIVNTASIAGFEGQRGQVAYTASKAGIIGITLPIARDLAYYGIRVATIAPGLFDTPILKGLSPEAKQDLARDIQFPRRLGDPRDFAILAEHIVRNPYVNGETIRLDAALRMAAG
jgi:NAD(P)-dependent dehydrogenase (short-subunit alcohol dehydrogenase family)